MFGQDTIKNKEDCGELIKQCKRVMDLMKRAEWQTNKDELSTLLQGALRELGM